MKRLCFLATVASLSYISNAVQLEEAPTATAAKPPAATPPKRQPAPPGTMGVVPNSQLVYMNHGFPCSDDWECDYYANGGPKMTEDG
eukprot:CAMPEP_0170459734 /NCGR_PEP_ID=MMETSP0123-20130129/6321_1 /TAXON_ID=182087 /ORGANISM="Favella ehrenbergii, Strain Fehren 1" /LENGTH=86 /DNA_ID=CAMNT_0010724413 /DNA_START=22 /DNA_END=282 /DNA_ORIENTATION=-